MKSSYPRLGLGTVQWGLHYGIANTAGQTPASEIYAILDHARKCGIEILDTASSYGSAESVLGAQNLEGFCIVTKTPALADSKIESRHADKVKQTFNQSLIKLSQPAVYGLLVHQADDLLKPGSEWLIAALRELKDEGLVRKIGVSIYSSEQVYKILEIFTPDVMQVPINVLDQRLLNNGCLVELCANGVELHARSIFLQGLLLMPLERIPAYFQPLRPILTEWHERVRENSMTLTQAALSFVKQLECLDTVLIGVENKAQLLTSSVDFSIDRSFDAAGLACEDPAFVNPALWPQK